MRRPDSHIRFLIASVAACFLFLLPAFGDSQARMVRLSDVEGSVQVDRNTGQGFEKAFLNLPITQGVKIRTGVMGRAELEFEDSSTLRITPNTDIEVVQLSLRDSGGKVSAIHLTKGAAYLNYVGASNDDFELTFAHQKISPTEPTHLRIQLTDTDVAVAVLKGDVTVESGSDKVEVAKSHTATFDLLDNDRHQVARGISDDPNDAWDKQQTQYDQTYASNSYSSYSPYPYGTADLNYYGNFFNAPGYGMLWQPYLAGAGWDPFMSGAWAFYPGFGFGWVSGYPWGWTPYHYGSWMYLPAYGWAWQPGGAWMGWNAMPVVLNAPIGFATPKVPALPGPRIIVANRGTAPSVVGKSINKVQVPANSAGLGIPRGSVENLGRLSAAVQHQGFAVTNLHLTPAAPSAWHSGFSQPAVGGSSGFHGSSGHVSSGHSSGTHR